MSEFIIYDASNFETINYKDINTLKEFLLGKIKKDFFVIDKNGNEYKDDINVLCNLKEQKCEYVIHNNNMDFISESLYDNTNSLSINEIKEKIKIQKKIVSIINESLVQRKNKIQKTFDVCEEIMEKCDNFKDEGDSMKKFEENFSEFKDNEELKKIMDIIKNSGDQLKNNSAEYKENLENTKKNKDEVINEIDRIIDYKMEGLGQADTNDEKELRKIYTNYSKFIKEKITKINDKNDLIYELGLNINQKLLMEGEKINFYINLTEIPTIYESFTDDLEKELKRRCYFKYLYEKIIKQMMDDFFSKEFEEKKKFLQKKLSKINRIEKKTIEILLKLFDIKQEKIYEKLNKEIERNDITKIGSIYDNDEDNDKEKIDFDKALVEKLEEIKSSIESLKKDLYSDKKINNLPSKIDEKNKNFKPEIEEIRNKLKSIAIPEIQKKELLDLIESKIIKDVNTVDASAKTCPTETNQRGMEISLIDMSGFYDKSTIIAEEKNERLISEVAKFFTEKYANFLWFYNKVFEYLEIYNSVEKKYELKKEDPFSLNNCIIEILNDNKKMKEKIKKIKEYMKI